MKRNFTVHPDCLRPADETDLKWLKKQEIGSTVSAEFKTFRNIGHHRKYWAVCNLVAQNSDTLRTAEMVSDYCKLKAGLVEYRIVVGDEVIVKTKSISFKMPQEEFTEFYKIAIQVMSEVSGIGTYDLEGNWREYYEGIKE